MKSLRVITVASALLLMEPWFAQPALAQAQSTERSSRELTGELVVLDGVAHRFRLVGHGGTFAAPAGTSVEAFSGKPVIVDLSADGHVAAIREEVIHLRPISHGFEIVSGQLTVLDPAARTFAIAGDARRYVAPADFPLAEYSGRLVRFRVDEDGQVVDMEALAGSSSARAGIGCGEEGQIYAQGTLLCRFGTQYRCAAGTWRSLGMACAADGAASGLAAPASCAVGDATVASGSAICRGGTTFRCSAGEWVRTGTPCS